MKKSFLFIGYESFLKDEIKEFITNYKGEVYFANSTEQSIHLLEKYSIDIVVLALHRVGDAAVLKYINQYFPNVKVLIKATDEFDSIIKILNKGTYSYLSNPFKLKELSSYC